MASLEVALGEMLAVALKLAPAPPAVPGGGSIELITASQKTSPFLMSSVCPLQSSSLTFDTRHLSQVMSSFQAADPGDAGERTVSPSCEARPLSLACLLDRSGGKGTIQVVTLWRPVFSTFSGLAFTCRSPESIEFWGTLLWAPWKYRGVGEQVLVRGGYCMDGADRGPLDAPFFLFVL